MGITTEDIVAFTVIVGALAGVWYRVEGAIGKVRDDLAAYKLEVARSYALNTYLRDVEGRVIAQIDKVANELHEMRKDIANAIQTVSERNKRTRS